MNNLYKLLSCLKAALFLIVCLFQTRSAWAVEEPYVNELRGAQVAAGQYFSVIDEKFKTTGSWSLIDHSVTQKVDNILSFEINFDTTVHFYNAPFTCTINVDIICFSNANDTTEITDQYNNVTLSVLFDTVAGKPYKGIAYYKFANAHKYTVVINNINYSLGGTPPPIFRLKGQTIINRKYVFEDASTGFTLYNLQGNRLELGWTLSDYPGAEMFDIEYTVVDSMSAAGYSLQNSFYSGGVYNVPEDTLVKWFTNNSTRVVTASNSYLINLMYNSGFILFRMRGVQLRGEDENIRYEGNWNYDARLLSGGTIASGVVKIGWHEQNLNWQSSVAFAEEGKRKEVISYFDGAFKNRQSVTLNNSDKKSIIQETIYDKLGRPRLNVLPVPDIDSTIHYFKAFNKNISSDPYSYTDINDDDCIGVAAEMNTSSGSSKYYSSSNDFFSSFYYTKYIPNAERKPFAMTEYMPDNTGRIKRQGSVGPYLQIGTDHETKYYYGKPAQFELDRLFGTEAGKASHYLKNMVIDPNGQISVSYQNASGQTIATALAGTPPVNLQALPSVTDASTQMSGELITPADFTKNSADKSLSAFATFLAPLTGTYTLRYDTDPMQLQVYHGPTNDSVICSTCYYDLEILVKDDCNNLIDSAIRSAGFIFDTSCTISNAIHDSLLVDITSIGEYYVSYNLKVSGEALNYYDSVHLEKNSNLYKFNHFLLDELEAADFYACYNDCSTCKTSLGTKQEFFASFKKLYVQDSVLFQIPDSLYVLKLYDSLWQNCLNIQVNCKKSPCDEKLDLLKFDVSPGGQYALYDSTSFTLIETDINVLSKRNQIARFTDESGKRDSILLFGSNGQDSLVDVKNLPEDLFIQHFKSVWADSLVRLHPEYCHYQWCVANSSSYTFDEDLKEEITNADTATDLLYFNPSDYAALLKKDPFFSSGYGSGYYKAMEDSLRLFSRTIYKLSQTDKNVLEFVDRILYCKDQCDGWNNCSIDGGCRAPNREWELYKLLYLNLKQRFYEMARKNSSDAIFANCVNCFIGQSPLQLNLNTDPEEYEPFELPASCALDTCSGGVYSPIDRPKLSLYIEPGMPGTPPSGTPEGYSGCEFYNHYSVMTESGNCRFTNVWVCTFDSTEQVTFCPTTEPGMFRTVSLFVREYSDGNCPASAGYVIWTYIGPPMGPNWVHYRKVSYTQRDYITNAIVARFDTTLTFTSTITSRKVCIPASYGQYYYFDPETGEEGYSYAIAYSTAFCKKIENLDDTCPSDTNAVKYANKQKRYPEYVNTSKLYREFLTINPAQNSEASGEQVGEQCASNCEAMAESWIKVLSKCSTNPTLLNTLKTHLIAICSNGCSMDNPFGTSSVPGSVPLTYHSFEEAIIGVLGSGAINDSCAAELLATPYPYNRIPNISKRMIAETDDELCTRLQEIETAYTGSGFSGSLHQYLKNEYPIDYDLDSLELVDLFNACENCNGILKDDISLPLAFEPGARPCLTCDTAMLVRNAFYNKFPGIDSTDENFEILFQTFFNHYLGYSLSATDYINFIHGCQLGNTTAKMCGQPQLLESGPSGNSCTVELFTIALTNAQNAYVKYIDSVRTAFRNAYLTKCLNVQPSLNMRAELFEYHYTLYYYDQAGNLVKTIPPAGVKLLSDIDLKEVERYRLFNQENCYQYSDSITFNNNASISFPHTTALNPGANPFTVESWISLNSFADQDIFTKLDNTKGWKLNIVSGKLRLSAYAVDGLGAPLAAVAETPTLSSLMSVDDWTHIAIQRTSSYSSPFKIYINGTDVPLSYIVDTLKTGNLNTTTDFYVAHNNISSSTQFSGSIKNLRWYNRTLTATELQQNAFNDCQVPASTGGLQLWAPMNSADDNIVKDVALQNNGTLTGITWTAYNGVFPGHTMPTNYEYNSLNQVINQNTPDGGLVEFWYDRLGRLVASQNAVQKVLIPDFTGNLTKFSYTMYDKLGRIREVGEHQIPVDYDIRNFNTRNDEELNNWMSSYIYSTQTTETLYDNPIYFDKQSVIGSRKRVVASIYKPNRDDYPNDSTLYAYDLNGNVKTVIQHIHDLVTLDPDNGKKQIDYNYDLISGKVNKVAYQQGKGDQFFYKYLYDADNRVIESQSSRDNLIWNTDASYNYYLHGPLVRTELGKYKVQGIDYAYTLQGWLKGINSRVMDPYRDMGEDGSSSGIFTRVSRDAYGYTLGYFANDYKVISGNGLAFIPVYETPNGVIPETGNGLFNGNISHATVYLSKVNGGNVSGYSYLYDQLNRLKEMNQHTVNPLGNTWSNSGINSAYQEKINYDPNGNILAYHRDGANTVGNPLDMDKLKYHYQPGTNKLDFITDTVSSSNYPMDIDDQDTLNYVYDEIGNLISDASEGIIGIHWNVYGKMTGVYKSGSISTTFKYDASGNRVSKTFSSPSTGAITTYYLRDPQGNVLSTYRDSVGTLTWDEQHLYGSSRLGIVNIHAAVSEDPVVVSESTPYIYDSSLIGQKVYELSNHLGNVLTTVNDKKIGIDENTDDVTDYYLPEVMSASDYYPFGMQQPGRTFSLNDYRYGFNGKENDNEVKGTGNQQDYGMRIYDPRLGRFLSTDPIEKDYPDLTPYQFASNTPIWAFDLDGLEGMAATGVSGHGMIINTETAQKVNYRIVNWVSNKHNQGVRNVNIAEGARKMAIQQGRLDGDGINWWTKTMMYIGPWWNSSATLTDANDGAVLMSGQNLDGSRASTGDYVTSGIGVFIPLVSGGAIKKAGTALVEGTISVFKNGKEVQELAFKIGKYGHKGTKEYNSIVNAIKSGGNIVANSKEEALQFLKEAMPGIVDETGKVTSKFGYRIDDVVDSSKDGLKQGHQGLHVNYYDKENKVNGTIIIEGDK